MRISDWSSDVCSSDLHDADGGMAAGANFIALAPEAGEVTVNLNYIYVVPEARGRGNLERSVRAVAQAAGEVFARPPKDVVIFIEQNDPLRMAEADQLRDTVHSGMDQYDRLAIRSEEHTSELQSLMRISYAVFCLKKK